MLSHALCLCLLAGSLSAATLSKTAPLRQRQSFYGTKGGQLQQQQQQEEEAALPNFVEPPAAPAPEPDAGEPMMPYEFEYSAAATGGSSARREVNDGTRVTGTYTLAGPDGINRVVHYVADKDGFRATIVTNEPGTESQSPSGVILNSSQLPAEQIALQYGPREPAPGPVVRFPAPIPAVPVFQASPLIVVQSPARLVATTEAQTSTTSLPSSPAAPSAPARLLAAAGIKGSAAPIIQQRLSPVQARKTAPIVQQRQEAVKAAPIVQQRQEAVKTAPIVQQRQEAVKAAPIVQQRQEAIKAPAAAIKAPATIKAPLRIPPRPSLAPIKAAPIVQQRQEQRQPSKTAPLRLQGKTAPLKAPRQPFYATLPPPPPPPPAPTTTTVAQRQLDQLVQQRDEQQQQQEEPQQLEQLRQQPEQQRETLQQQQQDQQEDQEADNGSDSTFFE